jgi:DNA damage-binding protein 1
MYNYQVTAHPATAVTHSLLGNFTSSTTQSLVLSKGTRIEVYEVTEQGLQPILDVPIYGRIGAMEKFRPNPEGLDLIFISTERFKFCVLGIDPERKVFVTKSHGDLSDRYGAVADFGQLLFIDPESRLIGLHLYRGMLKIIPVSGRSGNLQDAINIRLEELHVIDIKFLEGPKPTVAVLYQDQREMRHVKTYEISVKEKEILEGPWNAPNVEVGASLLVPLKEPLGGVLLLGERSITYFNGDKSKSIAIKPMLIRAYSHIGNDQTRLLFADHSGRLWLLLLKLSSDGKNLLDFKLELLGETSAASCISYLDNHVVFIGSTLGDSQLIRITPDRDESSGDFLQLLENYTNIGPIVDMATVDVDRIASGSHNRAIGHSAVSAATLQSSAPASSSSMDASGSVTSPAYNASSLPQLNSTQTQIVTCSGAFKDGSLRVIRNGIGISEHAELELEGILRVFALPFASNPSSSESSAMDLDVVGGASGHSLPAEKLLFLSYVSETRLLKISGEELEEMILPGSSLAEPTLLACALPVPNLLLQITPMAVYVIDSVQKKQVDAWKPSAGHKITVAACTGTTIALGLGASLQLLKFDTDGVKLQVSHDVKAMPHEISCVGLFEEGGSTLFCGVGQWHDNTVHVLHVNAQRFKEVARKEMGGEILARSVVFAKFEENSVNLLVGMGDGTVNSFVFDPAAAQHAAATESAGNEDGILSQRQKMVLGRQPVVLIPFTNKGKLNVLACGDRPTVIYGRNGKVVFAPVNLPHVTGVCELNTSEFPDALAFATKEALRIGSVDEIQRLHIKTIHLGEMARRVAHHRPARAYVLASAKYEVNETSGEETEVCSIKLLDDTEFSILDTFKLDFYECAESVTTVTFSGDPRTYAVVGTGYIVPTESEPTKGRLLVFEVESHTTSSLGASTSAMTGATKVTGHLKLIHEVQVKGMVWCLSAFASGKLVCGVAYAIQLYTWLETRDGNRELKLECEHTNHVQALCIATKGDLIYVGDLMRGSSLLQYKPVDSRLEQLAMDLRPNCILAVAILEDNHFLAAENSLNLLTVQYNSDPSLSPDEREFLNPVGSFHLGDQPNAFRSGSLVLQIPDSDSLLLPSILYATSSGAIGVIASLPKDLYDQLAALQKSVLSTIKGIGGLSHSEWRAYNDNRKISPSSNFIDGDLIESILDFAPPDQQKLAKSAGMEVDAMIKLIESVSQATH